MTTNELEYIEISNNKIAEFMGAVSTDEKTIEILSSGIVIAVPSDRFRMITWSKPNGLNDELYKRYSSKDMILGHWHYHESWDWLMPVIDEIDKVCNYAIFHYYWNERPDIRIFREPLHVVYKEIIMFIDYFNEHKHLIKNLDEHNEDTVG